MTSPLGEEDLRREARQAWASETERIASPSFTAAWVLCLTLGAGAFTLGAVAVRLSFLFEAPGAAALVLGLGALFCLATVVSPALVLRRRRALARAAAARARTERRAGASCPRCDAPLLARDGVEAGDRRCGACHARLLEAEGLLVVHNGDPRFRRLRWRAQARARLGVEALARPSWELSPVLYTTLTLAGIVTLWASAALLGGAPPSTIEAPLALDRQISLHGTARARSEGPAEPVGPPTRPLAPLWPGTQVLARRGSGPYHQLAAIVRVEPPRAFVVYANGGSAWVRAPDVLAPELGPGDALEVADGAGFVAAELVARMGPAVRVRLSAGEGRWTSASLVRVRSDARHVMGVGLESEIPPGAWVEARTGSVLRPGLMMGYSRDYLRMRVVFSCGSAGWLDPADVHPQAIGPGVTVSIDGWPRPLIVAARLGDALAVVDADGTRSWTSLARVSRALP